MKIQLNEYSDRKGNMEAAPYLQGVNDYGIKNPFGINSEQVQRRCPFTLKGTLNWMWDWDVP